MSTSHYDTLAVPPDATPEQIKAAYRKLAALHHPDREGGSHEAMAAVQAAYDCLSDPAQRAAYDAGQSGDTEASLDRAAQDVLRGLFEACIEGDGRGWVASLDLIEVTRVNLESHVPTLRKNIKSCEAKRARLRKWRGRVVRTGSGSNIVDELVEARIAEVNEALHSYTRSLELNRRALALLDNFKDTGAGLDSGWTLIGVSR